MIHLITASLRGTESCSLISTRPTSPRAGKRKTANTTSDSLFVIFSKPTRRPTAPTRQGSCHGGSSKNLTSPLTLLYMRGLGSRLGLLLEPPDLETVLQRRLSEAGNNKRVWPLLGNLFASLGVFPRGWDGKLCLDTEKLV